MSIIKIGSRKSQLAIKQTEAVIKKLKEHFPNDTFEIVGISTKGDRQLDKSLQSFGGKGVFIKEIETALLSGEIDMAVHSAKDMPTEICVPHFFATTEVMCLFILGTLNYPI